MNQADRLRADLREELDVRVRAWEKRDAPVLELRRPGDLFLATSSLQKSIRRNLMSDAMMYAVALGRTYRHYVWRRLAIIAMEDVGQGDPRLAAMALLLASEPDLRRELGADRALTWLAGELAQARGDRVACNLLVSIDHPNLRDDLIRLRTREQLVAAIEYHDLDLGKVVRAVQAAQELTRRGDFPGVIASVARDVDDLTCWTAMTGHAISLEGLEYALPFARMLANASVSQVVETDVETPRIAWWLAPAVDKHARAGMAALRRFVEECAPLADLLRAVPPAKRVAAAGWLVFAAEGSVLRRKVVYAGSSTAARWCAEACLATAGAPMALLDEGTAIVRGHLPLLHQCRTRIVANRSSG